MRLRVLQSLGSLFGVVLAAAALAPAGAANINRATVECQVEFFPANELYRTDYGIATLDTTEQPQTVICSVPRSPLVTGTNGLFYVDGDNYNGASTMCHITSFDQNSHLVYYVSFTTAEPHYDALLNIPIDRLPSLGHTTLSCYLPAHGNGRIRGVTSVQ